MLFHAFSCAVISFQVQNLPMSHVISSNMFCWWMQLQLAWIAQSLKWLSMSWMTGVWSLERARCLPFATMSRQAVGSIQFLSSDYWELFTPKAKNSWRINRHWPLSSSKGNNTWNFVTWCLRDSFNSPNILTFILVHIKLFWHYVRFEASDTSSDTNLADTYLSLRWLSVDVSTESLHTTIWSVISCVITHISSDTINVCITGSTIQTIVTPGIRTFFSLNTAHSYKCIEALETSLATRFLIIQHCSGTHLLPVLLPWITVRATEC